MRETAAPVQKTKAITATLSPLVLQRCACGGSGGHSGECAECKKKRLGLQRKEAGAAPALAPPIVHEVLRSPGRPLEAETRTSMERRFGHDFGRVRVHADAQAAASARAVGALAYTVGNHIAFAASRYAPGQEAGRRLLAHELAHTVQQSAGGVAAGGPLQIGALDDRWEREANAFAEGAAVAVTPAGPAIQRQEIDVDLELVSPEESAALRERGIDLPEVSPQTAADLGADLPGTVLNGLPWSRCGRPRGGTLRVSGYNGRTTGTYIRAINVTIEPNATSNVSLTWRNAGASPGATLPTSFDASPGAGNCSTDCSDPALNQVSGSHCTPTGSFVVEGHGCRLSSDRRARFVTWFHYAREIAFHYYSTVPAFPASHGCVRLKPSEQAAEWIYDNVLPGITQVFVSRDSTAGPGPKCWRRGRLINRPTSGGGPGGSP